MVPGAQGKRNYFSLVLICNVDKCHCILCTLVNWNYTCHTRTGQPPYYDCYKFCPSFNVDQSFLVTFDCVNLAFQFHLNAKFDPQTFLGSGACSVTADYQPLN